MSELQGVTLNGEPLRIQLGAEPWINGLGGDLCKRGHDLRLAENTYYAQEGRHCAVCRREQGRAYSRKYLDSLTPEERDRRKAVAREWRLKNAARRKIDAYHGNERMAWKWFAWVERSVKRESSIMGAGLTVITKDELRNPGFKVISKTGISYERLYDKQEEESLDS